MYKFIALFFTLITALLASGCDNKDNPKASNDLQVVIIRHGEKPEKGDNLSCQGQNRALALATVLHEKVGTLSELMVPALDTDSATKHSRMFQTASPFAIKYNLTINSKYDAKDSEKVAKHVLKQNGTVLMVWEHSAIRDLAEKLGVKHAEKWPDGDFDSIWRITYTDGKATLTLDKERLNPAPDCRF